MFSEISSACLFDSQTRQECLEALDSPLAKLTEAFNFEKYRAEIVDCIKREVAKKKISNQEPSKSSPQLFSEPDLPSVSPRDSIRLPLFVKISFQG